MKKTILLFICLLFQVILSSASHGDDFESGTDGWTATGMWHLVGQSSPYPKSHSPTHSWWYGLDYNGTYSNGSTNSGNLISPTYIVPVNGYLSFWSWEQTEGGSYFDSRTVYAKFNDGNWQQIYTSPNSNNSWHNVIIDLSAYAGMAVQIKFEFNTRDSLYNNYRGWYVDDVEVGPSFSVIKVSPSDRAIISENSRFIVQFSKRLDLTTITPQSVIVRGSSSGPIDYEYTYLDDINSLVITILSNPLLDETIDLSVTTELKNTDGQALTSSANWSFTVGNESDEGLPAQVMGITAQDVPNDGGGEIEIVWSASLDQDFSYYAIYRSDERIENSLHLIPHTYSLINEVTDKTVDGAEYYYIVNSVDYAGNESVDSIVVGPVVSIDNPPQSPAGLVGSQNNDGIYLYWNQNQEKDLAGYKVYYGTKSGEYSGSVDVGNLTNFTLSGLVSCTDYFISVVAYDLGGNQSPLSYEIKRNSGNEGSPAVSTGLRTSSTDGSINLSWDRNGECDFSHYYVYRSGSQDFGYSYITTRYGAGSTSYSDRSTVHGNTYYYKVVAVDNYGAASPYSEPVSAIAANTIPPNVPGQPQASPYVSGIYTYWTSNNGSTGDLAGYKVYYGTVSGQLTQTYTTPSTYAYLSSLTDCTDYYIAVSAYDLSGNESARSSERMYNSGTSGSPSAPTSLTAASEDGKIRIQWQANPECDIQDYYVYRSTDNYNYLRLSTVAQTSYEDMRIAHGATYYYKVIARDRAGATSSYSQVTSAVGIDTTPPVTPVNVSSYYDSYYQRIRVNWSASTDPAVSHYKIDYGTVSGQYGQSTTTTSTYRDFYNLNSCTPYYFAVTAVDLSGNESPLSVETSSTFNGSSSLQAPTGLAASAAESVSHLVWNPNTECDLRGYKVLRSTTSSSGFQEIGTVYNQTSFDDRAVANSVRYYYQVRAFNYAGTNSPVSATVSVIAIDTTPPQAPGSPYLSGGDNYIDVSWPASPSPDVKEYQVLFGTEAGTYEAPLVTTSASLRISGLQNCLTYYVAVKAVDLTGLQSPYSPERNTYLSLSGAPAAPVELAAEVNRDTATLTWLPNAECDLQEYNIYRSLTRGAGHTYIGQTTGTTYSNTDLAAETTYYYIVRAVDRQGLSSSPSQEVSIVTGDLTPPVPPTIDPDLLLFSNLQTFTLRGTKEINSSIIINGQQVVPVDELSTWEAVATLSGSSNLFNIASADPYGNICDPVPVQVYLDVQGPTLSSSIPASGALVNQLQTITVVLQDPNPGSGVNMVESMAGAVVRTGSEMEVTGSWSVTGNAVIFVPELPFADGVHTVQLQPKDNLGNSRTVEFSFTLDMTPPEVSSLVMSPDSPHGVETVTFTLGISEPMNTSVQPSVVFTPEGGSGTSVEIGGTWINATTWRGSHAFAENSGNGTYIVKVSGGKDLAGNPIIEQAVGSFLLDTTRPVPPVIGSYPSPTTVSKVILQGEKEAETSLFINNKDTGTVFSANTWSYEVSLMEGSNSFDIFAMDAVGNRSPSVSIDIIRDTTAPVLMSSMPKVNTTSNLTGAISVVLADTSSDINFEASIAGALVKTSAGAIVAGSWSVFDTTLVFTPETVLSDGGYSVTLYPADTMGNTGTVAFTFTTDSSSPVVNYLSMTPDSPHKAETVTFTLVFSETMNMGGQPGVELLKNGLLFNTVHTLSGSWLNGTTWRGQYIFTSSAGDGEYTVTIASAKDVAGNIMAEQSAGSFILDTVPPAAPTLNPATTPTNLATQVLTGGKPANTAIFINGQQKVALSAETTWSVSYPLQEGANLLEIIARDAAGNSSPPADATTIHLDTTPPFFIIDVYQPRASTATQTLSGRKEPGCTVRLDGQVIIEPTDLQDTWSYEVTLTEGISTRLTFVATDALGNPTSRTVDLLFDASPPPALGAGVLQADGSGRGTEVTLSWPVYPEPADLAYYRIYVNGAEFTELDGLTAVGTVNLGTKTFKVTGLQEGTTYWFAVEPVDSSGNFETTVNSASAIPTDAAPPEEVTNLSAQVGYSQAQGNMVTLSWKVSANSKGDLADQVLYVDGGGTGYDIGTFLGKTVTSHTVTGLADATLYKFRITTRDEGERESAGTIAQVVTRLPNPTGLSAEAGKNQVVLRWNRVDSPYLANYKVYRKLSAQPQTDVSGMEPIAGLSGTSYTATGLVNDSTYQFAATAVNTSGTERTEVETVAATPRQDATGPVIGTFNLAPNQVISAPLTIEASASDAESAMGKVELYLDSVLVATGNGSSVSWYWNVLETTDGNHTIKVVAFDALGNRTEASRAVVVSLAPPATPQIVSHLTESAAPIYTVKTSGSAPLYTIVTLRVNGTVVGTSAAGGTGFAFSGLALVEGENRLAAKATHRGGDSPWSADYKITVDTGAPAAPTVFAAQALAGGTVQFTWQAGAGETPTGYNLYASSSPFTAVSETGVSKVNATPIGYLFKELIPASDGELYYAVTALDGAGNESGLSNVVDIASDRSLPTVAAVTFAAGDGAPAASLITGPAVVKVSLTVNEPLKELPFFSLEPQAGSPIVVTLSKTDDLHYSGSFRVDATSPHGPTTWKFSGKDAIGNRGSQQGAGPVLDVRGPAATITAPVGLQQIAAAVPVAVTFDEAPVGTPVLEFKDVAGAVEPVTGITQTFDSRHWSGSLDLSALAEGEGSFRLTSATDGFGNVSTTVAGGQKLLLYLNAPPAPAVPQGLTAQAQAGGRIELLWKAANGANAYRLYRRIEGGEFVLFATQTATGYADLPEVDGLYAYAVSAVGFLASESDLCAEVWVTANRTSPSAPAELALSLEGSGVKATWSAPEGEASASYRLYRAAAPLVSVDSLTAVATASVTEAVDAAPNSTLRHYAVTALDTLGNESVPSESVSIDFPVAPVRNLVLTQIEGGKPSLTWEAPQGGLQGYFIYRNGQKVNAAPTPGTSYTDGYYAGGSVVYGISALDAFGNESPTRELTLPDFAIALPEGTQLRRGLLESVSVNLISSAGATVKELRLKVGSATESTLPGPFTLAAGEPLTVQKVAATPLDVSGTVAVVGTAVIEPAPGSTLRLTRTSLAQVAPSGSALEIFSEPLIRGTSASVRLKVNNLGSARMDFVTSENGGATAQVRVLLKDQDGNLLAEGRLDQRTGSQVVNSGSYATARIEPGQSLLTEPITFQIPTSAPYAVVIEAVVANTYYHYGWPDQVAAPGLRQTFDATINEVSYAVTALAERDVYKQGEKVLITGHATSSVTGGPMGSVPVRLGISVKGFDRFYTVTTDPNGDFRFTYDPGTGAAGTYSVWASHPDVGGRSVQDTFDIIGMRLDQTLINLKLAKGTYFDVPLRLQNLGNIPLTGLSIEVTASSGISAAFMGGAQDTRDLAGGENRALTFRVGSTTNSPDTGFITATLSSAEGFTEKLIVNVALVGTYPILRTSPTYIDAGMMRGTQKVESFTVSNTGLGNLNNARLEGPSTPWMALTVNPDIGSLAVGQKVSVGVLLRPDASVPPGIYNDRIVIRSDNHIPYTFNIQVTVTSDALGNVVFDVLNELYEDVAGASITLQHQSLPELFYTLRTGADGTATIFDIPEGRYSFMASATGHKSYGGSLTVQPGLTLTVPVALEVTLVQVEWSVTEITIEDRYEIKIEQTFETNVPTAVIVVDPPAIVVPILDPGGVFNGEVRITNYGLISAKFLGMEFPATIGDVDLEVLNTIPDKLGANQTVVVPYRLTRREQP